MITAIVTILIFLIMISLHEFGHFITAKLLGIKVLEYAIGFGPVLLKSKKTETQYSLRLIPFGGYCKFEGEDEESKDPRAFCNQKVWKRILVVIAGGVANIILGFVLFLAIIPGSGDIVTNYVSAPVAGSYAEKAGLMAGDEIVEINGKNVSCYSEISLYTEDFTRETDCEITVKRYDGKHKLSFKPSTSQIIYNYTDEELYIYEYVNGVQIGETVIMEGEELSDGSVLEIKPEEEFTRRTTERLIIGFNPAREKATFFNVPGEAWNQTKFVVKLVYHSLWDLVTGEAGMETVSGPVGVVTVVNDAVNSGKHSWLYVLNLTALLTINLGVFNLLPIPALDGGRLFFMLVELITRRKIPTEKEGLIHAIGFALFIALAVFISFNDIMRLLGK